MARIRRFPLAQRSPISSGVIDGDRAPDQPAGRSNAAVEAAGAARRRRPRFLRWWPSEGAQPGAARPPRAAKDIKDLITNSSSQVQEGRRALVNQTGSSLTEESWARSRQVADIVFGDRLGQPGSNRPASTRSTRALQPDGRGGPSQNSAPGRGERRPPPRRWSTSRRPMNEKVAFFKLDDHGGLPHAGPAGAKAPVAAATRLAAKPAAKRGAGNRCAKPGGGSWPAGRQAGRRGGPVGAALPGGGPRPPWRKTRTGRNFKEPPRQTRPGAPTPGGFSRACTTGPVPASGRHFALWLQPKS